MKKLSLLWVLILMLSGSTTLSGCSSNEEDVSINDTNPYGNFVLTRKGGSYDDKGIVVNQFQRNGMTLQVLDITEQFESAMFYNNTIPVNHILVEQLPTSIKNLVIKEGMESATRIVRMNYKGEYYYDIYMMLSSTFVNIFNSNGERHEFLSTEEYEHFMSEANDLSCILVLTTDVLKNADGAPNNLIGYWKNDWQHLIHDHDQQASVTLYPELPFSITEIMSFNEDGTGYLRTVKTYKSDGRNEVSLDPFHYEITDYHGGDQYGYHGYYYKCFFEAGDVIEYLGRSYDNMQTLCSGLAFVYFPWFKMSEDPFESLSVNAGQKYGNPGRDKNSPIVGRWKGEYKNTTISASGTFTWVFRSDNTGYRLYNGQINEPFAYTVTYHGSDAELTIYKYNTDFVVSDGFAKNTGELDFDPTILPKGQVIKAKINGDTLEMDDWGTYQREE